MIQADCQWMKRASMQVDVVSAKKCFTVFGFPGCEAQNMDRIDKLTNGEDERSYAGAPRPLSAQRSQSARRRQAPLGAIQMLEH
jgi:hypothetical protein